MNNKCLSKAISASFKDIFTWRWFRITPLDGFFRSCTVKLSIDIKLVRKLMINLPLLTSCWRKRKWKNRPMSRMYQEVSQIFYFRTVGRFRDAKIRATIVASRTLPGKPRSWPHALKGLNPTKQTKQTVSEWPRVYLCLRDVKFKKK